MVLAEAATTPPWWGVPIIAGLFTILGVIAAQAVTWLLDRRRAERETQNRWHGERQQVYVSFLAAITTIETRIWVTWESPDFEALDDLNKAVVLRRSEVQLIASKGVRSAADDVFEELQKVLDELVRSSGNDEIRATVYQNLIAAHDAVLSEARKELGTDV